MKKTPYAIIIMDGYGLNPDANGNAIAMDGSLNVHALQKEYPSATLGASGRSVGLPDGQMGNSEVGHLNMGAGRIVYQDLTKITKEIEDGEFFENPALIHAMDSAKNNNKQLHLWGLLSDGGVHSHITHLFALLEMAKRRGVPQTFVHCFMDGRDVSPTSGAGFAEQLQAEMDKLGYGKIASVCGRYYAMDRDNNWDRIEKAYDMLTVGTGIHAENAAEALRASYAGGVTDEFVLPTNIVENGKPVALVKEGDSIIFFNFRPDRAREITRAFSQDPFVVPKGTANMCASPSMTQSTRTLRSPSPSSRSTTRWANTLPRWARSSSASPRRRSTPTSPSSSTAASRSPTRTKCACSSTPPRSQRTICSPRCRRPK